LPQAGQEAGLLEAVVLSRLLSSAPSLEDVNLEGEAPLPMSQLCGRESLNLHVDPLLEEPHSPDASFKSQASVNLSHGKLGDPSAALIGFAIATNTRLTTLDLGYNQLKPEGIAWLGKGLAAGAPALASLSLAWNRLGPEGLSTLAAAAVASTSLTALNVDNNAVCGVNDFGQGTFNTDGLEALGAALEAKQQLTKINLSNNALGGCTLRGTGIRTSEGIEVLQATLPSSGVSDLTLDGNHLGSELAHILMDTLQKRETVTSLRLADCHLTDGGDPKASQALHTIATMLKADRFAVLSLDGNRLGSHGAEVLADALGGEYLKGMAKAGKLSLCDLHLDREGNQLDEQAEALLSNAFGGLVEKGANACLHLARSAAGATTAFEKKQQKAELRVADYLRNASITPSTATVFSILQGETAMISPSSRNASPLKADSKVDSKADTKDGTPSPPVSKRMNAPAPRRPKRTS